MLLLFLLALCLMVIVLLYARNDHLCKKNSDLSKKNSDLREKLSAQAQVLQDCRTQLCAERKDHTTTKLELWSKEGQCLQLEEHCQRMQFRPVRMTFGASSNTPLPRVRAPQENNPWTVSQSKFQQAFMTPEEVALHKIFTQLAIEYKQKGEVWAMTQYQCLQH